MVAVYTEKSLVSAEEIQAHLNTFLGSADEAARRRSGEFLQKFADDDAVRSLEAEYPNLAAELRRPVLEIYLAVASEYSLRRLVERIFEERGPTHREGLELIRPRLLFLFGPLVELKKQLERQPSLQTEIHQLIVASGFFEQLRLMFGHSNERVVLYALRQAYRYPTVDLIKMIRPFLKARNWQLRYNAVMVMTRLAFDPARDLVFAALQDPVEKIRDAAAAHLSLHLEEYRARILETLTAADEGLAQTLLRVIAAAGDVGFLPQLVDLARRDDARVAPAAVAAAVEIVKRLLVGGELAETSETFLPISRAILDLSDREYGRTVTHQIRQLVRLCGIPILKLLLGQATPGVPVERSVLARYIQGIESFFDEIAFQRLCQEGEEIFSRYLRILIFFSGQAGYEFIQRNLDSLRGEELRLTGETLLAMRTDPAMVREAFRPFTASTREDVRLAAYQVLAGCGGGDLLPLLQREIDSGDAGRIRIALVALAAFRGREALQLLVEIYGRPDFSEWKSLVLEAIGSRREPETLEILLRLLPTEDESGRRAVAERIGAFLARQNRDTGGTVTPAEDILREMIDELAACPPRTAEMLRPWAEYSRRNGAALLEHVRACLQLPETVWRPQHLRLACFLVGLPLFSALEQWLTDPGHGNMERALEILRRADLLSIFRFHFAELLENGLLDNARLRQLQNAGRPALGAALAVALFQGDPGLRLTLLDAIDERLLPPLGPVLQWLVRHQSEDAVIAERSLFWLARLRSAEASEFLVDLSADRSHPLADRARQLLDESREGQLL